MKFSIPATLLRQLTGHSRVESWFRAWRSSPISLSYSVALQALEPKSSPRRRRGLDASTDRGLTESSGEVFLLDILSHRMSEIAIYRQLSALTERIPLNAIHIFSGRRL